MTLGGGKHAETVTFVPKLWPQFVATAAGLSRYFSNRPDFLKNVSIATLGAFSLGSVLGWTSPSLPQLKEAGELMSANTTRVELQSWIGSSAPVSPSP